MSRFRVLYAEQHYNMVLVEVEVGHPPVEEPPMFAYTVLQVEQCTINH